MSGFIEKVLALHNWWNGVNKVKASITKSSQPTRFGVLSAAAINPAAIFDPIATHPDAVVSAIAARDVRRAEAQIAKYRLKNVTAYGSYDQLLADPDIDAVYIPLPNGLHYEWTIKALEAGKHVLIEKPIASNTREAAQIRDTAERTGNVALEAFHWRFHPAAHYVKELVDSGTYGALKSVAVKFHLTAGFFPKDDIRFQYRLGGGSCMDLTYVFSASSYFSSAGENTAVEVLRTEPRISKTDTKIDEAMKSTFTLTNPGKPAVTCNVDAELALPNLFGIIPRFWAGLPTATIELEKAQIQYNNFPAPWAKHSITIRERDGKGDLTGKKEARTCYKGGPEWGKIGEKWWTTYRYQLEAFIARTRESKALNPAEGVEGGTQAPGGGSVKHKSGLSGGLWMTMGESIGVMSVIDAVYRKAGLPCRGED
ncbi:MAG: hypothetical protein Q9160_008115 [Pyrenula sp. 1 TL-2023]